MELDNVVYASWTLYLPVRLLACIRVPYPSQCSSHCPQCEGILTAARNPTNASPLPRYPMLHDKRHTANRLADQLTQLLRREIEKFIVEALLGHLLPFANNP